MIATTEKKIAIRKAPNEKASAYDDGYLSYGADDVVYVVKADKNGIKRWMKQKASEQPSVDERK